jgi:NADH-quinone oxidoreductase subunit C
MAEKPVLDHPSLPIIKEAFPNVKFMAAEFRGLTTVVCPPDRMHDVLRQLRDDPRLDYNFLTDVVGIDYLKYPVKQPGRFAVIYLLNSHKKDLRIAVKCYLEPTIDTSGIAEDPALEIDSACDLWAGAEWTEREVYDMFGIRFRNHPDLRRILMWKDFPAHPLRKDYPLRGRGEREHHVPITRDSR